MIEKLLNSLEKAVNYSFSRKNFIRAGMAGFIYFIFNGKYGKKAFATSGVVLEPRAAREIKTDFHASVATGQDPAKITRAAVDALGGMSRFVKKGDKVVVKPNIGWDRNPEQAANTNPKVVEELVKMSFEAGAKIVKVFDFTCNDAKRTYQNSGIYDAVKRAGGTIFYISDWKFYPARFPANSMMADWPLYKDAVDCDCFINVPIAKHHSLARLTLSMKNLMGICGDDRGRMHQKIDPKLVEVANFIKPDLTVVDAYRILLRNGPSGGNLEDVQMKNTVIASKDYVLADAYAATLFGLKPHDIGYIKLASQKGHGSMDVNSANIKFVKV